ncbi:hypothetical protein FZEAL_9999, partial [Fusarium zealandicum]
MDRRNAGFADKVGRGLTTGILFALSKWKLIMVGYAFVAIVGGVYG